MKVWKNGELKKAKEVALSMAEDGMKAEKIARYLKVDAIMVQKWINESSCVHTESNDELKTLH